MSNWSNPDVPEPKVKGRGIDTKVEIKIDGIVLQLSFDSRTEAEAFIDAYANATSIAIS